jgi:hypothetical protein
MKLRYITTAILLGATTPITLHARCPLPNINAARRDAALVFEGTITRLQSLNNVERAATLEVRRVWKGEVSKQTTVYFSSRRQGLRPAVHGVVVIFAMPQTPDLRKEDQVPRDSPQRSIWLPPCYGAISSTKTLIKQLGQSRPPSDR